MLSDYDTLFEIQIIKCKRVVSGIESKVLVMYVRGMSQRDISKISENLYGFEISYQKISKLTDSVLLELEDWQDRPLQKCYTFLFADCI